MASSNSARMIVEKVYNETQCCICTETFEDPRILPCTHTFCRPCLKKCVKSLFLHSGDAMPCPVCRQNVTVPDNEFAGMPKNFFMQHLIDIMKSRSQNSCGGASTLCDACREAVEPESAGIILPAEVYCINCQQALCEECATYHRKNKMTKLHKVVPAGSIADMDLQKKLIPVLCEVHGKECLIYCEDCKIVVCPLCFVEEHVQHKGSDVNKMLHNFKKQVQSHVDEISEHIVESRQRKKTLAKDKQSFSERLEVIRRLIEDKKKKMKQLIDANATRIQSDLDTLASEKFREIDTEADAAEELLSQMETYHDYCCSVMNDVPTGVILETLDNIGTTAADIREKHQLQMKQTLSYPSFRFAETNLNEENLIGRFDVTEDERDTKVIKPCDAAAQSSPFPKSAAGAASALEEEVIATVYDAWVDRFCLAIDKLSTSLASTKDGTDKYMDQPVLCKTIHTKVSVSDKERVTGMAILDDEIFVVHSNTCDVDVYDVDSLELSERLCPSRLDNPGDIAACENNQCLYIHDEAFCEESSYILKVSRNGNLIKRWITGKNCSATISVSFDKNVILAYTGRNLIKEYTPEGRLLRQFDGDNSFRTVGIQHALKKSPDVFIVCRKDVSDTNHDLRAVDLSRTHEDRIYQKFSNAEDSDFGLDLPLYLAFDDSDNILVVSQESRRVLLCDSNLMFRRTLLTNRNSIRFPDRIMFDKHGGRLFVADRWYDFTKKEFSESRILVFKVKDI